MGSASSTISPKKLEELAGVEHLVIFVHGLGMNGHRHGLYLQQRVNEEEFTLRTKLYLASANVGHYHSVQTLHNTLGGIKAGGDRLAQELDQLFRRKFHRQRALGRTWLICPQKGKLPRV